MTALKLRKRLLKQRRFRQIFVGAFLLSLILGIAIIPIERQQMRTAEIVTLSDGIWWSVQTLTTVGYGDIVPHTELGRLLGMILQIIGTVMFGVMIAMISTTMGRSQEEFFWNRLFERLNSLESEIMSLKKQSQFIVKDQYDHGKNQDHSV